MDRYLLDRVIAVPQSVPLGTLGLSATGKIGRTRADYEVIRFQLAQSVPTTASCNDCVR
jgi:hypothetical protein